RYSALAKHGEDIYQAIELLERCLQRYRPAEAAHHIALLFELGSLYDRVGDYDTAFDTYRKANEARHQVLDMHFDADTHSAYVNAIISNCSRPLLSRHAHCGNSSTVPVFIVGVPRSGTTLVEQILSNHPQVHGAGELTAIKEIVDALPGISATTQPYPGCLDSITDQGLASAGSEYVAGLTALNGSVRRITDKMPANFMHLGLIQMLLPRARVIHCRRDPLDTCLSYYFHDFSSPHSYSYRLEDLAVYYQNYLRLMAHWRTVLDIQLLEVQYEDLVSNQESTSRELVEFCGLDWDDACLSFHENRRAVATTSYDQVRKPMYTSSVGRWKNYRAQLQPLISALGTGG
ncbi:MAG TPA: sulfotransferase family protein, partial [Gammaproteobacteria bacterium]|nr:sulfotransferase family protein [Gammaproteobacteria bacterium]